jgi:hypothetical protein
LGLWIAGSVPVDDAFAMLVEQSRFGLGTTPGDHGRGIKEKQLSVVGEFRAALTDQMKGTFAGGEFLSADQRIRNLDRRVVEQASTSSELPLSTMGLSLPARN